MIGIILSSAESLISAFSTIRSEKRHNKEQMALVLDSIAKCLESISVAESTLELRGPCAELNHYAEHFYDWELDFDTESAFENLGWQLASFVAGPGNIESDMQLRNGSADKYRDKLAVAAGRFRAEATFLRTT
jgi:hypothetical protein